MQAWEVPALDNLLLLGRRPFQTTASNPRPGHKPQAVHVHRQQLPMCPSGDHPFTSAALMVTLQSIRPIQHIILKVTLTATFELSDRVTITVTPKMIAGMVLPLAATAQIPLPSFMTTAIMAMMTIMTAQHLTIMMTAAIRAMMIMIARTSVTTMSKMLILIQAQTRRLFGLGLKLAIALSFPQQQISQRSIITALEDVFVFRGIGMMMVLLHSFQFARGACSVKHHSR